MVRGNAEGWDSTLIVSLLVAAGALMLGGLVSFAGAVLALWLVREREIEREPVESEPPPAVGAGQLV